MPLPTPTAQTFNRMYKFVSLLTLFFLFGQATPAQDSGHIKDSLRALIASRAPDTAKAQALDRLGKMTESSNIDSAISCYRQMYQLSKKTNYRRGILVYHHRMTHALALKGRFEDALEEADTYTELARDFGDVKEEVKSYNERAIVYEMKGAPDKAIAAYKQCIEMAEKGGYKNELIVAYSNITVLYARQNLFDDALFFQRKAIAFDAAQNNSNDLAMDYLNLAGIFSEMKQIDSSLHYSRLGIQLARQAGNMAVVMQIEHNLVLIFVDKGQTDSALVYARRARNSAIAMGHGPGILRTTVTLAYACHAAKRKTDALRYMDSAKVLLDASPEQKPEQFYYYETLYGIYKDNGNYKAALSAYEQYRTVKDSVVNGENQQMMIQYKQATEQADVNRKMMAKELHISRQRTWVWILSLSCAGLLLSSVIYYGYQRKKNEAGKQTIIALEKERELVAAHALLEGQQKERVRISKEIHDELGSSLTSISLLTEVLRKRLDVQQNPEVLRISATSADMIDKMSEIVWALNTSNDTISSLVAYIRRFAGDFLNDAGIQLEYEEQPLPEDRPIESIARQHIYLTVKEAINNVIKHAGAGKVKLKVDAAAGLHILISDNGKGLTADRAAGFGNGLRNMKTRMEAIGGQLEVESGDGTIVRLYYPSAS
jgi:signal transduction histidine kinase